MECSLLLASATSNRTAALISQSVRPSGMAGGGHGGSGPARLCYGGEGVGGWYVFD